jgi:hypothetical protein
VKVITAVSGGDGAPIDHLKKNLKNSLHQLNSYTQSPNVPLAMLNKLQYLFSLFKPWNTIFIGTLPKSVVTKDEEEEDAEYESDESVGEGEMWIVQKNYKCLDRDLNPLTRCLIWL